MKNNISKTKPSEKNDMVFSVCRFHLNLGLIKLEFLYILHSLSSCYTSQVAFGKLHCAVERMHLKG